MEGHVRRYVRIWKEVWRDMEGDMEGHERNWKDKRTKGERE